MSTVSTSLAQIIQEIWESFPDYTLGIQKDDYAILILNPKNNTALSSPNLCKYFNEWPSNSQNFEEAFRSLGEILEADVLQKIQSENLFTQYISTEHPDYRKAILESRRNTEGSIVISIQPDLEYFKTLELAINSGNIGIWQWDLAQQKIELDDAWYTMMDYPEGQRPDLSDTWREMVHPEDLEDLESNLKGYIHGHQAYFESEHRIIDGKGVYRWVLVRGKARKRNEVGEVEDLIGIHKDISTRKENSQRFDRALEFLERSNKIAGIGYWEVDLVNEKVHWSGETKRIHGVAEDYIPILDKAIEFFPEGKHRMRIIELVENAIHKNEHYDEVLQIRTIQGELIWVRAVGIPDVQNGTTIGLYGLFQDINRFKHTETELRKNETLFRQTFEYASIGMALVGLQGQWLKVNQSLCRFLEYEETELKNLSFQDITHPEDLNSDLELLGQCLDGSIDNYQMEKRYLTKTGQTVWALLAVSIVKDADGVPQHFISQITNIDASKKLLGRVQDQNERLLNFAHIVSHNLRSHATNNALMLEMLELDIPEVNKLQSYEHLIRASNNLAETIHHLNEITAMQLETNQHLEALDLVGFLEKNIKALKSDLDSVGGTIEMSCKPATYVLGVAAYIDSIVFNILSNSIKYHSSKRPLQIKVSCRLADGLLCLDIQDNGLGIDMNKNGEKLFGLYKTFHQNEDAKGVGLFISRNQAEAMGGKLEATSSLDQGSTFTLSLRTNAKFSGFSNRQNLS